MSIASRLQKSASLDWPSIVTERSLPSFARNFTVTEMTPASSYSMVTPPVDFHVVALASTHMLQGNISVKLAPW